MAALARSSLLFTFPHNPSPFPSLNRTSPFRPPLRFQSPKTFAPSFRPIAVAAVDTAKVEKLSSELKTLTLEEARKLVDLLQVDLGVSAASFAVAAPTAVAGVAPADAAPAVEEQTEFDVILDEVPSSQRIAVIKVIRSLTTLGLKEAKDLIEGLPKNIKEAVSKEDAEVAKKQLEAAGAKCSIK